MRKRRLEIAVLAALMLLAAAERPSFTMSVDLSACHELRDLMPRPLAMVRDMGVVATKLLLGWTGRGA